MEVTAYPDSAWPDPMRQRADAERRATFTAPRDPL